MMHCTKCHELTQRNRQRILGNALVKTFCRVCGTAMLLSVPRVYQQAVDWAYGVDDSRLDHGAHTEVGGWGLHWRLDDVLAAVFPELHTEELFPMTPWYKHRWPEEPAALFPVGPVRGVLRTWTESQARQEFTFLGMSTPGIWVRRRSDGVGGRLMYDDGLYFNFTEDE
jgi:hypothetical protein